MIYPLGWRGKIVEHMSGSHNDEHQARQQPVPPL
jgi:hypothetical protein